MSRIPYAKTRAVIGVGFAGVILGHLILGDHASRTGGFNWFDCLLSALFVICIRFAVGKDPADTIRSFAKSWRDFKTRTVEHPVALFSPRTEEVQNQVDRYRTAVPPDSATIRVGKPKRHRPKKGSPAHRGALKGKPKPR